MNNIEELYNFLDSNAIVSMYICDGGNQDLFLLQLFPDNITVCDRNSYSIYDISLERILLAVNEERVTFYTEEPIDIF